MERCQAFLALKCPLCNAEMYRGYLPNYRDKDKQCFRIDASTRTLYVQCRECKKEVAFPICPYCLNDSGIKSPLFFCGYCSGCVMPELISNYCVSKCYDTDDRCDDVSENQVKIFIDSFYKDKLVIGKRNKDFKFQWRNPTKEEFKGESK